MVVVCFETLAGLRKTASRMQLRYEPEASSRLNGRTAACCCPSASGVPAITASGHFGLTLESVQCQIWFTNSDPNSTVPWVATPNSSGRARCFGGTFSPKDMTLKHQTRLWDLSTPSVVCFQVILGACGKVIHITRNVIFSKSDVSRIESHIGHN